MTVEKIATVDITEAIAKAMENADSINKIVILYETLDSEDTSHGVIMNGNLSLADANYLLDMGKNWIFNQ